METPYYAVIFTSTKTQDLQDYQQWDDHMLELVQKEAGFLGYESYTNREGKSVTISYWKNMESISHWKNNILHQQAQELGKLKWYKNYRIRVCKVERDYELTA